MGALVDRPCWKPDHHSCRSGGEVNWNGGVFICSKSPTERQCCGPGISFSGRPLRMMRMFAKLEPMNMNKPAVNSFGGRLRPVVVALLLGIPATAISAPSTGPAVGAPAAGARAATMSFNFNNIPVRSALQLIAEEAQFNLVVSDSVQGTITLRLKDVTWEQALDIVLQMKGLGYRIDSAASTLTVTGG